MTSIKIENSTLNRHLQMPLTTKSKFNYLYNISTILEWKNISSTVYKVMLSLQMLEYSLERLTNPSKGIINSLRSVASIIVNSNSQLHS